MVLLLTAGVGATTAEAQTDTLPLSNARVSAIEPVLEAAVILDAQKPAQAKIDTFTRRCRALHTFDRLISAFRATCRTDGDSFIANLRLPTCKSTDRCRARIRRYADNLRKQAAASRTFNTRLKDEVADTDCRSAMRISERALVAMTRLRSAANQILRAISRGSQQDVAKGQARFFSIDRSSLLDHRGRLDAFRAACI
jgi:hypothetical protein